MDKSGSYKNLDPLVHEILALHLFEFSFNKYAELVDEKTLKALYEKKVQ
jgi:hypothetical protein